MRRRPNIRSGSPSCCLTRSSSPRAPHGFNSAMLPGSVVRIRGHEARHRFALAREFFAVVAWERAFTCHETIIRDDDERTYGRHLTVVRGALVISGGLTVPKVYN